MLKKCFALTLALLLVVSCFGCGSKSRQSGAADGVSTTMAQPDKEKETTVKTLAEGNKIAFLVNTPEQDVEFNPVVMRIADGYDRSVMTVAIPDESVEDPLNVMRTAVATALDPQVKVMVFSGAAAGVANALKEVRAQRDDVTLIVCDPVEDTAEMREYADLILRVDYAAYAADAVRRAKEMGAVNFVLLTSERELKLFDVATMKKAAQDTCAKEKMTFKAVACPDMLESGRTQESGEQFIAEEASRQMEKLGEKTALFCVSPQLQGALARQAALRGMVMPATFRPSPLAIAEGVGVSLDGHETDAAYAMQQLREQAETLGIQGRVATWGVSMPDVMMQTAFACAQAVVDGDALSEQAVRKALPDDAVTVAADGVVYTLSAETTVF